jgi:hypothetical protein
VQALDCRLAEDGGRRCTGLSAARQNGPFDRFPNSGLSGAQIDEVVAAYCEEVAIDQRQYGNARSLRRPAAQPGDVIGIAQRQSPRSAAFRLVDHELQRDYHDQCYANIKYQKCRAAQIERVHLALRYIEQISIKLAPALRGAPCAAKQSRPIERSAARDCFAVASNDDWSELCT